MASGAFQGQVALVTGAGVRIGRSIALRLAGEGADVVVNYATSREAAEGVVREIEAMGRRAVAVQGDVSRKADVLKVFASTDKQLGRLDILVNNAGLNITDRHWNKLTPAGIDELVHGNLSAALYCVTVALPFMRAQQDGLLIHTASMAGRFIGGFSGPIYTAAKHGVVAMSHSINMEECVNGIRSTVFLPGEVATPILDKRPNPVGSEERARMVQASDCGDLIRYIACLPKHVVMNEVMLAPTHNRGYVAALQRKL